MNSKMQFDVEQLLKPLDIQVISSTDYCISMYIFSLHFSAIHTLPNEANFIWVFSALYWKYRKDVCMMMCTVLCFISNIPHNEYKMQFDVEQLLKPHDIEVISSADYCNSMYIFALLFSAIYTPTNEANFIWRFTALYWKYSLKMFKWWCHEFCFISNISHTE